MFRAVRVSLAVLALSGFAAAARAQTLPSIPGGNVTVTLPSQEVTSTPAAPTDPRRFASLGLISINPFAFMVLPPTQRFVPANGVLRDRFVVRQRRAVRTR